MVKPMKMVKKKRSWLSGVRGLVKTKGEVQRNFREVKILSQYYNSEYISLHTCPYPQTGQYSLFINGWISIKV